jgi:hypothetical protein
MLPGLAGFISIKLTPDEKSEANKKLNVFQKEVQNLFENRRRELRVFGFQIPGSKTFLPSDVSEIFMQKSEEVWLQYVSQMRKLNSWLPKEKSALQISLKGSQLLVTFFVELQTFQILPNEIVSLFLNKSSSGKFILYPLVSSFHYQWCNSYVTVTQSNS